MPPPALWIDAHHYGRRVIARNVEPWLKPAELGLFYKQLTDLLRPQLIEVPLLPLMRTRLADTLAEVADPQEAAGIIADMLGAAAFAQALYEGLGTIAGGNLHCLAALALPGPDALVEALAPHAASAADDDTRDTLAITLTEVVRRLTGISLPRLILHENSASALGMCDVLLNLTRDYRIPVTLITDCTAGQIPAGVESVMTATATAVAWRAGQRPQALSDRLWESPDDVNAADWLDAPVVRLVVPQQAAPEIVMQALARLARAH